MGGGASKRVEPLRLDGGGRSRTYHPDSPGKLDKREQVLVQQVSKIVRKHSDKSDGLLKDALISELTKAGISIEIQAQNIEAARAVGMPDLVNIGNDTRSALSSRRDARYPIFHLGLIDVADIHVLRLALFSVACRPSRKIRFQMRDRSTWTMENLKAQDMVTLIRMQLHAGPDYYALTYNMMNVICLDNERSNNVWQFSDFLFPIDKSALTAKAGQSLEFRLMASAFESGNVFNTREQLMELRTILFQPAAAPEPPPSIEGTVTQSEGASNRSQTISRTVQAITNAATLTKLLRKATTESSNECLASIESFALKTAPLNAVTLPDAARARARIPLSARFYTFCYPIDEDPVTSLEQKVRGGTTGINMDDPFVSWLLTGAFLYFDYKYDIIGINAISFAEQSAAASATLCLGESTLLPLSAIQPLAEYGRWTSITANGFDTFGFTHFAWVTPSEFLSDHIFTPSGGFAYLHASDWDEEQSDFNWDADCTSKLVLTHSGQSRFFPVVPRMLTVANPRELDPKTKEPKLVNKLTELGNLPLETGIAIVDRMTKDAKEGKAGPKPLKYDNPIHVDELMHPNSKPGMSADKFVTMSPSSALFADGARSAIGLPTVLGYKDESDILASIWAKIAGGVEGSQPDPLAIIQWEAEKVTEALITQLVNEGNVWLAGEEKPADYAKEVLANMRYVLHETASIEEVRGNDGGIALKDSGHQHEDGRGWTLDDFHQHEKAKAANLSKAEVACLRLYTSSTFRVINGPLRGNIMPHPLAATTLLISNALKKMRAVHMSSNTKFRSLFLWRGMRNRTVSDNFMLKGGAEIACMSTSNSLEVVAGYAKSQVPLLFRIKVDTPMQLGADIQWLSIYPGEAEVLYPPLTYLKPLFKQRIKGLQAGEVVTLVPSFPS